MSSTKVPRIIAIIILCTSLVVAQTIQYSRGWTNGRKRGGVMMAQRPAGLFNGYPLEQRAAILSAAAALLEEVGLLYANGGITCQPGVSPGIVQDSAQHSRSAFESRRTDASVTQDTDESTDRRRRETRKIMPTAAESNWN